MRRARAEEAEAVSARQPPDNVQTVYVIKLLERSSQFRVRAQAAISLGMMEQSPATRAALTAALQDAHPAVRAAAATSLGRIGDATNINALRRLWTDPEAAVRNAARGSIGRIESTVDEVPTVLTPTAATAALSASASSHRM